MSSFAILAGTLLLGFAILNVKGLPFVHTIRLLPSACRIFGPRLLPSFKKVGDGATAQTTILRRLFASITTSSRATIFDLDINVHKSNSTFFADADINRAELFSRAFGQALIDVTGTKGQPANLILSGVQAKFVREVKPYQAYEISSQILSWDDEGLWFVTWFVKPGVARRLGVEGSADKELAKSVGDVLHDDNLRKGIFAILVSKYVVRAGRRRVKPVDLFKTAGLAGDGAGIEVARSQGLEYVQNCMM